ncbi:MAG: methyltransferase domain-containing protein [Pseudomonadota bacterium]
MAEWNPEKYAQFGGLRLRPAIDLLSAVPAMPEGDIVDLGCGAGVMAEPLAARFGSRRLLGVDSSTAMLEKARAVGLYRDLVEADIDQWVPETAPALIFSNAALNWLGDHAGLMERLATYLAPGGTLAVQMPRQSARPSHGLWRELSGEMYPDRFDWSDWESEVHGPAFYASLLSEIGEARVWQTEYFQSLEAAQDAHPVRLFTASTYGRRVLDKLSAVEQTRFEARYDAAVAGAYPLEEDGSCWFPFRRLFFILTRPTG